MEEWALHSWQPLREAHMGSRCISTGTAYQQHAEGMFPETSHVDVHGGCMDNGGKKGSEVITEEACIVVRCFCICVDKIWKSYTAKEKVQNKPDSIKSFHVGKRYRQNCFGHGIIVSVGLYCCSRSLKLDFLKYTINIPVGIISQSTYIYNPHILHASPVEIIFLYGGEIFIVLITSWSDFVARAKEAYMSNVTCVATAARAVLAPRTDEKYLEGAACNVLSFCHFSVNKIEKAMTCTVISIDSVKNTMLRLTYACASVERTKLRMSNVCDSNERTKLRITYSCDNVGRTKLRMTYACASQERTKLQMSNYCDSMEITKIQMSNFCDSNERTKLQMSNSCDSNERTKLQMTNSCDSNERTKLQMSNSCDSNERTKLQMSNYCDSNERTKLQMSNSCDSNERTKLQMSNSCDSNERTKLQMSHSCDSNERTKLQMSNSCDSVEKIKLGITYSCNSVERVSTLKFSCFNSPRFLFLDTNNNSNSPPSSELHDDDTFNRNSGDNFIMLEHADSPCCPQRRSKSLQISKLPRKSGKDYLHLQNHMTKNLCRRRSHQQRVMLSSRLKMLQMIKGASDIAMSDLYFDGNNECRESAYISNSCMREIEASQVYFTSEEEMGSSDASHSESISRCSSLPAESNSIFLVSELQDNDCSSLQDNDCSSLQDNDCSSLQDNDCSSLQDNDCSSLQDNDCSSLQDNDCSSLQDNDCSSLQMSRCTKDVEDCLNTMCWSRSDEPSQSIKGFQMSRQTLVDAADDASCPANSSREYDKPAEGQLIYSSRCVTKGRNNNSRGDNSICSDDQRSFCGNKVQQWQRRAELPPPVAKTKYNHYNHVDRVPENQDAASASWTSKKARTYPRSMTSIHQRGRPTKLGTCESKQQASMGNLNSTDVAWACGIKKPNLQTPETNDFCDEHIFVRKSPTKDGKYRVHKINKCDSFWTKQKQYRHIKPQQRSPVTDQTYTLPCSPCHPLKVNSTTLTESLVTPETPSQDSSHQKPLPKFGSNLYGAKSSLIKMAKYAPVIYNHQKDKSKIKNTRHNENSRIDNEVMKHDQFKSHIVRTDNRRHNENSSIDDEVMKHNQFKSHIVRTDNRRHNENSSIDDEVMKHDQFKSHIVGTENRRHNEWTHSSIKTGKRSQNKTIITSGDDNEKRNNQTSFQARLNCDVCGDGHGDKLAHTLLGQTDNADAKSMINYKFDGDHVNKLANRSTLFRKTGNVDVSGVDHRTKLANRPSTQTDNVDVKSSINYKYDSSRFEHLNKLANRPTLFRQTDNIDVKSSINYKCNVDHRKKLANRPNLLRQTDNVDVKSSSNYKFDSSRCDHLSKLANTLLRQTDNVDHKSIYNYKFDDTETCRTSSTWNEDTTLSRSLKRDTRRSHGKSSCTNILNDPKLSTDVKRKVEILVKSYRDFLEKEEAKQRKAGLCLASHGVETGHEAPKTVQGSSTSDQFSITKRDEEVLSTPPVGVEKTACDKDVRSFWKDPHESNSCIQSFPRNFINVTNVKEPMIIDMSGGLKFSVSSLAPESETSNVSVGVIRNQRLGECPRNSASVSANVGKEKRKKSLNSKQTAAVVPRKKSKLENNKFNVHNRSAKSAFTNIEHCQTDFYNKKENEVLFEKEATEISSRPECDLILTYNLENGAQSYVTMQHDQCQQTTSAADEKSQCFTFLINDNNTIECNNEMLRCNSGPFKYNMDTVFCLGGQNKILLEVKQCDRKKCRQLNASRIPLYVGIDKKCSETHCSQNQKFKYQQSKRVLSHVHNCSPSKKRAIEKRRDMCAEAEFVVEKKLTMKTTTIPSKIPIIISRLQGKKISRSKIPIAVRPKNGKCVNSFKKIREKYVEPLSTPMACPKEIRDFNQPKTLINQQRPAEKKQINCQNVKFQETIFLKNGHEGQLKPKGIIRRDNNKLEDASWLLASRNQPKTNFYAERKQPSYYFTSPCPQEACQEVPAETAWGTYAEYAEKSKKNDVVVSGNECKRSMERPTYNIEQNIIEGLRNESKKPRHKNLLAARRSVATEENKNRLVSGVKTVRTAFQSQLNTSKATFPSKIERTNYAQIDASPRGICPLNLDQQRFTRRSSLLFPKEVVIPTSCQQRANLLDESAYPDFKGNIIQRHAMEVGNTALSASVTFKSALSASSDESRCSFILPLGANWEHGMRKEATTIDHSPMDDFYHTELMCSPIKSISVIDTSTSSWRTASTGFDKQPEELPFVADIGLEDNSALADSQSYSLSSLNEHQSSKVYSISSYNIHDESNSDKSSFSTMRNISELPYTFPSLDRSSNFLVNDNYFRSNSPLAKSYLKNLQRHMNQKHDLVTGNYNASNRECWMSLSEPHLTIASSSKLMRVSKSVTSFSSVCVMSDNYHRHCSLIRHLNGRHCSLIRRLNGRHEPPHVSFEQSTQIVERSTGKLHKNAGESMCATMNAVQQARVSCRPSPVCTMTTQNNSRPVFPRKTNLDKSYNKSPIQNTFGHGSRIKYSPRSFQPESTKKLLYFCQKTSPNCSQVKANKACYVKLDDWHKVHSNKGPAHNINQESKGIMDSKSDVVSPRGLPTFANILKFWESMNPIKTWCKANAKRAKSPESPTGPPKIVLENRSSEENSTVFYSVVDESNGLRLLDRRWIALPRLTGKSDVDQRNSGDVKEIQHSAQHPRRSLDEHHYNQYKSCQYKLIQESVASTETFHSDLSDGVDMQQSRDIALRSPNISLMSYKTSVPESARSPSSAQQLTWANRNPARRVKCLRQKTIASRVWTPLIIMQKPAVNMHPFGITKDELEQIKYKQPNKDSIDICNIAYREVPNGTNRTPVKMVANRKFLQVEHSSCTDLHSAIESTPSKKTIFNCALSKEIGQTQTTESPDFKVKIPHSSSTCLLTTSGDQCFPISAGLDYTSSSSPEQAATTLKQIECLLHQKPVQRTPLESKASKGAQSLTNNTLKRNKRFIKSHIRTNTKQRASRNDQNSRVNLLITTDSNYSTNREQMFSSVTYSFSGLGSDCESWKHLSKPSSSLTPETEYDLSDAHLMVSSTASSTTSQQKTTNKFEQTTTDQVNSSELDRLSVSCLPGISSSQYQTVISDKRRTTERASINSAEENIYTCRNATSLRTTKGKANSFQSSMCTHQSVSSESETKMDFPQNHLIRLAGLSTEMRANENRKILKTNLEQKLAWKAKTKLSPDVSPKFFVTPQMHKMAVCGHRRLERLKCGTVVVKKMFVLPKCPSVEPQGLLDNRNQRGPTDVVEQKCRKHNHFDTNHWRENRDTCRKKFKLYPKRWGNKSELFFKERKQCRNCGATIDTSSDGTKHMIQQETTSSDGTKHMIKQEIISSTSAYETTKATSLLQEDLENKHIINKTINSPHRLAAMIKASPAGTVIISVRRKFKPLKSDQQKSRYCRGQLVQHVKKYNVKHRAGRTKKCLESASASSTNEFESPMSIEVSPKQSQIYPSVSRRLKESTIYQKTPLILPQRHLLGISPTEKNFYKGASIINRHTHPQFLPRQKQCDQRHPPISESSPTNSQKLQAFRISPLTLHRSEVSSVVGVSSTSQEYLLVRRHTESPVSPRSNHKDIKASNTMPYKYPQSFNLVQQSPYIDPHQKSDLPTMLNKTPLRTKHKTSQTRLPKKSSQTPVSTKICHSKTQFKKSLQNAKYIILRGSPGQKPVKETQNMNTRFLFSGSDLRVSVICPDLQKSEVPNIMERRNRQGIKASEVLDSNFSKVQYKRESCPSYDCLDLPSLSLPRLGSPKQSMHSAPSNLRPIRSTAATDICINNKNIHENATISGCERSPLNAQNVQSTKTIKSPSYLKFRCSSSEANGPEMYVSKTQAEHAQMNPPASMYVSKTQAEHAQVNPPASMYVSKTPAEHAQVNPPASQDHKGVITLKTHPMLKVQKQAHPGYLTPNLQTKLMKPSSVPCFSSTSSDLTDRYKRVGNVCSVQCLENTTSTDFISKFSNAVDQETSISNPKLNINQVFWNKHRSGNEQILSQPVVVDSSNPTDNTSCSQRFRDVEIVLGSDVPLSDFMNDLLKSLQVNSSQVSNDESCSFSVLNSQVRLVIDKIVGDDKCSYQNTDLFASKFKTSPKVLKDGNTQVDKLSSETATKSSDKESQNPTELTDQSSCEDKPKFIVQQDHAEKRVSKSHSRGINNEDTTANCRNTYNMNNQKDLPPRVQGIQLNPSKAPTADSVKHTAINVETITSQQTADESKSNKMIENTNKFMDTININMNKENSNYFHRRQQLLAQSSSSDSILLKKPRKKLRKVKPQETKKQTKEGIENNTRNMITKVERKDLTEKVPCPSSPALNLLLTAGELKHRESHNVNKHWKIRKLPDEQITFSKPQNYHLDKVIKSDNKVTVKFLANNKLKSCTRDKPEPRRSNVHESRPVKGLNATLLEQESQILLARDALAGQEYVLHSTLKDKARTLEARTEKYFYPDKRTKCPIHQQYLPGRGDRSTTKSQHFETHQAQPTVALKTNRNRKKSKHNELSPGKTTETLQLHVCGRNPLLGSDKDKTRLTRSSNLQTAVHDSSSWSTGQDLVSWIIAKKHKRNKEETAKAKSTMPANRGKTSVVAGQATDTKFEREHRSKGKISPVSTDKSHTSQMQQIVKLFTQFLSNNQQNSDHHTTVKARSSKQRCNYGDVITNQNYDAEVHSNSKKTSGDLSHLSVCQNESESFLQSETSPKRVNLAVANKNEKIFHGRSPSRKVGVDPNMLPRGLLLSHKNEPRNWCSREVAPQDCYVQAGDLNTKGAKTPCHIEKAGKSTNLQTIHSKPDSDDELFSERTNTILSQNQSRIVTDSTDLPTNKLDYNYLNTPEYTAPVHIRTVGTSTYSPKSTFSPEIDILRSQITDALNLSVFRNLGTSTDGSKSSPLMVNESSQTKPKTHTTTAARIRTVGTSTDFLGLRSVNGINDDFSDKESTETTTSGHVREVGTSTCLTFAKLRPLVEKARSYTKKDCLRSNLGAEKHPKQQIMQDQNPTSRKPPQSPFNARGRLTPSHSVEKVLPKMDKVMTKDTGKLPFVVNIPHKLEVRDAQESVLPPISFKEKQEDRSKRLCSQASSRLLPNYNEIKVKAPCSVCTLQNNINVSVVQRSDGKCVKLVVPPNESTVPYEIVVEPDSWNDGPAMVVADNGMVHVSFERSKREARGFKNIATNTNKLTVASSIGGASDDSVSFSGSSSSSNISRRSYASCHRSCQHCQRERQENNVSRGTSASSRRSCLHCHRERAETNVSRGSSASSHRSCCNYHRERAETNVSRGSCTSSHRHSLHYHKERHENVDVDNDLHTPEQTKSTQMDTSYISNVPLRKLSSGKLDSIAVSRDRGLGKVHKSTQYEVVHTRFENKEHPESTLARSDKPVGTLDGKKSLNATSTPQILPQVNLSRSETGDNQRQYKAGSNKETDTPVFKNCVGSGDRNLRRGDDKLTEMSKTKPDNEQSNIVKKLSFDLPEGSKTSCEIARYTPDACSVNNIEDTKKPTSKLQTSISPKEVTSSDETSSDSDESGSGTESEAPVSEREIDSSSITKAQSTEEDGEGKDSSSALYSSEESSVSTSKAKLLNSKTSQRQENPVKVTSGALSNVNKHAQPSPNTCDQNELRNQKEKETVSRRKTVVKFNEPLIHDITRSSNDNKSNLAQKSCQRPIARKAVKQDSSSEADSSAVSFPRKSALDSNSQKRLSDKCRNKTWQHETDEESDQNLPLSREVKHHLESRPCKQSQRISKRPNLRTTQGQVRFSDRVIEYSQQDPRVHVSCPSTEETGYSGNGKGKDMTTSAYSWQQSRNMYDNVPTSSNFNRFPNYLGAAIDLRGEGMRHQPSYAYFENNQSGLNYFPNSVHLTQSQLNAPRPDTALSWNLRASNQGTTTRTPRYMNNTSPFASPWSMQTDGFQRLPRRRTPAADRADSGYSELSTPTEVDLCEWDRAVTLKLQERERNALMKTA